MTATTAQSSGSGAARWRIHKFGGSSVADAACMRRVADILEADPCPRLGVVLSALNIFVAMRSLPFTHVVLLFLQGGQSIRRSF